MRAAKLTALTIAAGCVGFWELRRQLIGTPWPGLDRLYPAS